MKKLAFGFLLLSSSLTFCFNKVKEEEVSIDLNGNRKDTQEAVPKTLRFQPKKEAFLMIGIPGIIHEREDFECQERWRRTVSFLAQLSKESQ